MSWRTRSSRVTMSTIGTLPPCELMTISFSTPARWTLSPISSQSFVVVSQVEVSVPGEEICSFDLPTACTGRNVTGRSAGSSSITRRIMPSAMQVSV